MSLVLDASALIAVDRRDRTVGALLRTAQRERLVIRCSAGAVAQVWRDGARQVNLARVVAGLDVVALDLAAAKRVGARLAVTITRDAIDAHVAELVQEGDQLLTSDPENLRQLLGARARDVRIVAV